jgi:hypothetical protein
MHELADHPHSLSLPIDEETGYYWALEPHCPQLCPHEKRSTHSIEAMVDKFSLTDRTNNWATVMKTNVVRWCV